jgi:Carboxylesterase family
MIFVVIQLSVCFVTEGQLSSTEKPPVVVLVEAQTWQQSFANAIDASILATRGRLMVATVNFRLGVLGEYNTDVVCWGSNAATKSTKFGPKDGNKHSSANHIAMQIYWILFRLGVHSRLQQLSLMFKPS